MLLVMAGFAAKAQTLVHYWNFNTSTSESTLLTPTTTLVSGATVVHNSGTNSGGFTSAIQITSNTGQGFDNTNPNARNGDAAATHLRFNNPIGGNLVFSLPTTGFQNIMVKYATRRSGSGAHNQVIDYSLDGTNFTNLTTLQPVDGDPTLQTLDFTSIAGANNNPNFKVRISFTQGGGGLEGNNRFDNFTLDGTSLADNQPPVPVFAPVNNAVDVSTSVQPTIAFDRDIRLVDNSPISNTNVDDVVELRLNNAAGAAVPFDATYSNRVITIMPTNPLQNNRMYYVALKANTVEGSNDVAVADLRTTTFTTIAIQTTFNPGDLLPVAYRMNTSNADDEVAFLTLVNILPGTKINFTDAKYTTNAQPQCAGGFTFTAPPAGIAAGTVIRITTSPAASSQGIVTGSDFGLSSNGDQVIVYTGTAAAPAYLTALSSNGWVASNTSCGGSLSIRPAPLTDGTNALNMSTHPNAVSGNVVNAYYNGPQEGTRAFLTTEILNPANWVTAAGGTPAQEWPAYSFGGVPTVVAASVLNQTTLRVIFSKDLDEATATNPANFTGIANLGTVTRSNNGSLRDTLLLNFNSPFVQGTSYSLTINGVQSSLGIPMAAPFVFNFTYNTTIAFRQNFIVTGENTANLVVELTLTNPAPSSVQLVYKPTPWSTATLAGDVDMGAGTLTLNFTGASAATQTITIPVLNDAIAELDEYVVLQLENPTGLAITGTSYATAFIKDDDRQAPSPTREIELEYLSSFKANNPAGSSAEVVAYDAAARRLFITSGVQSRLDIADFSNPAAVALVKSVDITPYGSTITSVATANGIVACAVPANDGMTNGKVVLFNTNGDFINQVTVGVLPDMVTFSPDGKKILTANEGQPNDSYTTDPEGTVSVIDISGGAAALTQANVTTLLFTAFNAQETALKAQGVRKTKSTSTLSQDFEPEYITVSADSKKAWVTIQENNAVAEINLETTAITKVWGLGVKDFSSPMTGIDVSDNNGQVLIANWPLKAFYMPDAVGNYTVSGKTYLVTANEGDEKEYAGLNERTTVGASSVILDPTVFPHAAMLKQSYNMGRLRITNLNGDTDNDTDYDELYTVGPRSFSIWDAETGAQVYDSKDEIELYTSKHPVFGAIFNADHENNTPKSRSRSKGPEPEGVAVSQINGQHYAFVSLERIGGVMVYNVNDPANAVLVDYKNNRLTNSLGGDLGPETLIYISNETSPDGKAYLVVTNEISGNITIFQVKGAITTPVNLITYTARPVQGGAVELQWSTATEKNNKYFTIERSSDGRRYEVLNKVASKGDADYRQDYTLVDAKPGTGTLYYRLSQTDHDGKTVQKGVRVVQIDGSNLITVAPNPIKGNAIQIRGAGNASRLQVSLIDPAGRVLENRAVQIINGNGTLNMARKPAAGMYFLKIEGHPTQQVLVAD